MDSLAAKIRALADRIENDWLVATLPLRGAWQTPGEAEAFCRKFKPVVKCLMVHEHEIMRLLLAADKAGELPAAVSGDLVQAMLAWPDHVPGMLNSRWQHLIQRGLPRPMLGTESYGHLSADCARELADRIESGDGAAGSNEREQSANILPLFPHGGPNNPKLVALCERLREERSTGKSDKQIALDVVGKVDGRTKRADSLLAQVRRMVRRGDVNLPQNVRANK